MQRILTPLERVLRGADGVGVRQLLVVTAVCGGLYGALMGTYGGVFGERGWQVLISGSKVPLLLLVTFALCLPSFFVLNTLFGVRGDFGRVVRALVRCQAVLTVVLASLGPYTLVWYASFASYHQATLFNGAMFAVATFTAQVLLRAEYRELIAQNPRHRLLLVLWLLLYAFVAVQMAWILRPFIGDPNSPVQFFRQDTWGNAYLIVGKMIWDTLFR